MQYHAESTKSYKQNEHLSNILLAGQKAGQLIEQLLAFSRKDKEGFEALQMAPLIKSDYSILRSSLPSSIDIQLHVSEDLPNVLCNPLWQAS